MLSIVVMREETDCVSLKVVDCRPAVWPDFTEEFKQTIRLISSNTHTCAHSLFRGMVTVFISAQTRGNKACFLEEPSQSVCSSLPNKHTRSWGKGAPPSSSSTGGSGEPWLLSWCVTHVFTYYGADCMLSDSVDESRSQIMAKRHPIIYPGKNKPSMSWIFFEPSYCRWIKNTF